jgi:DUF1365 family protein
VEHAFRYPSYFLLLPLRSLRATPHAALRRNRWGWLSFHDRDHGEGGPDALAWFEDLLAREGITTPTARSGCTPSRACWAMSSSR